MSEEAQREPTEEMRAAFEEQLRRLTPADVIVQAVVSLINLAGRRLGLDPQAAGERDLEQARDGIDGARALLGVIERREDAEMVRQLREALSALQIEYAKLVGTAAAPAPASGDAGPPPGGAPDPPASDAGDTGPGPAQRSGRLWVPGS